MTGEEAIDFRARLAAWARSGELPVIHPFGNRDVSPASFDPSARRAGWIDMMTRALPLTIEASRVVIWRPNMWDSAAGGADAFVDVKIEEVDLVLPGVGPQLWVIDSEEPGEAGVVGQYSGPLIPGSNGRLSLVGLVIDNVTQLRREAVLGPDWSTTLDAERDMDRDAPAGLHAYALLTETDKPGALTAMILPCIDPGDSLGCVDALTVIVAAVAFMGLEIAAFERVELKRHTERRLRKRREEGVFEVVLRRRAPGGGEGNGGKLGVQFLVGWPIGFWRRQWYPSLRRHRPKYISPFVKGPEGAPFQAPRDVVAQVKR